MARNEQYIYIHAVDCHKEIRKKTVLEGETIAASEMRDNIDKLFEKMATAIPLALDGGLR